MSEITTEQMQEFIDEAQIGWSWRKPVHRGWPPLSVANAIRARLSDYDTLRAEWERLATEASHHQHDAFYAEQRAEKAEAERDELRLQLKYPDPEDMPGELAAKYCPFNDPLHFHHDGCPSEWAVEERANKAEAALAEVQPLVEAVMKAPMKVLRDLPSGGYSDIGPNTYTGDILRAALALRAARERKG